MWLSLSIAWTRKSQLDHGTKHQRQSQKFRFPGFRVVPMTWTDWVGVGLGGGPALFTLRFWGVFVPCRGCAHGELKMATDVANRISFLKHAYEVFYASCLSVGLLTCICLFMCCQLREQDNYPANISRTQLTKTTSNLIEKGSSLQCGQRTIPWRNECDDIPEICKLNMQMRAWLTLRSPRLCMSTVRSRELVVFFLARKSLQPQHQHAPQIHDQE